MTMYRRSNASASLFLALAVLCFGISWPAQGETQVSRVQIPVFYATDRAPMLRGGATIGWSTGFGPPAFGLLTGCISESPATLVAAPPDWWDRDGQHLPRGNYFRVHGHERLERAAFLTRINQRLTELQAADPARPRTVLLFIHGYNNDFDLAAQRVAQFSRDIGIRGVPVIYSWPSQSSTLAYGHDTTYAMRSTPYARDLIEGIITEIRPERLYIVAHSLGSRVAVNALRELSFTHPDLAGRVTSLVLLAPDFDSILFDRVAAPDLPRLAGRVTAYANHHDRALAVSRRWNGGYALGDFDTEPFIATGLMTIDTSDVGSSITRHSDFETERSFMREIAADFAGLVPDARSCLRRIVAADGARAFYRLAPRSPACAALTGGY